MGYYVTLTDSNFVIPETPEVLAAIHDMDTRFDAIKRGGSFGPEGKTEKWFSWMPQLSTFTTVREVFEALGFDCAEDVGGSVSLVAYDSKTGQEDLFLAVVAPFVEDGSYTEWRGEDGALYRFVVKDGRLHSQSAVVRWTEPDPLGIAHFDSVGSFADGTYRTFSIIVDPYNDDADTINNLIDDAVASHTV